MERRRTTSWAWKTHTHRKRWDPEPGSMRMGGVFIVASVSSAWAGGNLLTWEGTFWGRRPCLGSRRGKQPGRSLQTAQRSGSCSWNGRKKKEWIPHPNATGGNTSKCVKIAVGFNNHLPGARTPICSAKTQAASRLNKVCCAKAQNRVWHWLLSLE